MLQPTPTLPIPGQKQNPNYSLTDGIGGVCTISINMEPSSDGGRGSQLVDYSNLISIYSDSTSKQGYTIVTSTSYSSSKITGISSPYLYSDSGTSSYYFPLMGCGNLYTPINTVSVSMTATGQPYSGIVDALLEINLITLQYQYPNSFTQEELFEDLKTLPKIVITELKKLDCEKMQGALGLLEAFNSAKLAS